MIPMLTVSRYIKSIRPNRFISGAAIVILVCFPHGSFGTCIVIVQSKDTIWLATDSKQSNSDFTAFRYACKIRKDRAFYWAAAGPFYLDLATGFDVENLVKTVKYRGTLKQKMRAFIEQTKAPLAAELLSVGKDDPITYRKIITGEKALLEVVFVGMENGAPTLIWVNFTAHEIKQKLIVDGEPIVAAPPRTNSNFGVLGMGEYVAATTYLHGNTDNIRRDATAAIMQSMEAQRLASPQIVGGETSILRLRAKGTEWICKGECK